MNEFSVSADDVGLDAGKFASIALQASPHLQKSLPAPKQRTVLVLEDDPVQLQLLVHQLDSLGLKTLSAITIKQARQTLEEMPVELALLDVHLPDGSGLDLCASIDNDPKLTGLPVVILSNGAQPDIIRLTRASGGCYFLRKPYDPNVLLAIIERALGDCL